MCAEGNIMSRWASDKALVMLVPLLAVAGAVAIVVLASLPSGGPDSGVILLRAQISEEELLSQWTEGKALHMQDREYRRHGPAAEIIRARSDWYKPESVVHDLWIEVGAEGEFVRISGWVKDEDGVLFQKIVTEGDEVVTYSVATGAETRFPLAGSVQDFATLFREAEGHWRGEIESGSVRVVGEEMIDGRTAIIVEKTSLLPSNKPANGGYSNPYAADLFPLISAVHRTTIDKDSFMDFRWSFVVVDVAGEEHMIEDKERVIFEIVDASQVPTIP